jgi:benzoyl-CoA reductase/2-hydroxyglutaryl-CoA dehydratase subunit BcrC/BadD/HgdB
MILEKPPLSDLISEVETLTSGSWPEIASSLATHRPPIGFFCPYVPEELLWAAGALPLRLMEMPVKISHTQAHLQAYCCHPVKSTLEHYLRGNLDFLQGMVFSQSCDSIKGLAEIWADQGRLPFQFNLMVPSRLDSPLSREFLHAELLGLKTALEERMGTISEEKIWEAIRLFNGIREQLRTIYDRISREPDWLSGEMLGRIVRAGYLMDRERYLDFLRRFSGSEKVLTSGTSSGVPLYLSGNLVHSIDWMALIEEAGARVVYDDLCGGGRIFRWMVREEGDPLTALVDRYFSAYFCPTKYQGPLAHEEVLLKEIQASGARGVVFIFYKYCEPFYFDYPDLKKSMEAKGYPTLLLEIEDPSQAREQSKIRLQAFLEMLD